MTNLKQPRKPGLGKTVAQTVVGLMSCIQVAFAVDEDTVRFTVPVEVTNAPEGITEVWVRCDVRIGGSTQAVGTSEHLALDENGNASGTVTVTVTPRGDSTRFSSVNQVDNWLCALWAKLNDENGRTCRVDRERYHDGDPYYSCENVGPTNSDFERGDL